MRVLLAAAMLLAVLVVVAPHGAAGEDVATSITPSRVASGTTGVQLSVGGVTPTESTVVAFAGVSSNCDISGGEWDVRPAFTFAGGAPLPVVMEDVTEDGVPDLVFIDGSWSGVLVNSGGGAWSAVTSNAVSSNLAGVKTAGPFASAMALADMDLNGYVDVLFGADVVGGIDDNFAAWWVPTMGQGVTPNAPQRLTDSSKSSLGEITFMTTGDLNGDGLTDVVTLHAGSTSVSVLLSTHPYETQHGAVHFSVALSGVVSACTIADLHSSGQWHIVCSTTSGVYRINNDLEATELKNGLGSHAGTGSSKTIVVDDLDLDGKMEVVYVDSSGYATVLHNANPGDDSGWIAVSVSSSFTCARVAVGDVHMDGRLDVVCASSGSGIVVATAPEDITAAWGEPARPVTSFTSDPTLLEVRDVDGDLDLDITVVETGTLHVLANSHMFAPVPYTTTPVGWTPPVSRLSGVLDVCVSGDSGATFQHQSSVSLQVAGLHELVQRVEPRGPIVPGQTTTIDVPDTPDNVQLYVQPAWGVDVCNLNNFAGGRALADFTTSSKIVAGDVDGDGRTDFLAYDPFAGDLYVVAGRKPGTVTGLEEMMNPFEKISLGVFDPEDFGMARIRDTPHEDIFVLDSGNLWHVSARRDTHALSSYFISASIGSGNGVNDHLAFGDIRNTGLQSVITCRTVDDGGPLAGVRFFYHDGTSWNARDVTSPSHTGCIALASGNMDAQFGDDVVVAYSTGDIKAFVTQDLGESFLPAVTVSGANGEGWLGMVTADMDKDGLVDVVAWGDTNAVVRVFFQTLGGTYDPYDVLTSGKIGSMGSTLEVLDTNGDGWLDVALLDSTSQQINILYNPTDAGTIKAIDWMRVTIDSSDVPNVMALGSGDATHNGMRDLLLAQDGGAAASRYLLALNSRLQVSAESSVTSGVWSLAMHDETMWMDGALGDVELMVCARPSESMIAFPQHGVRLPLVEAGASEASQFEPEQMRLLSTVNVVTDLNSADGMEVGFTGKGTACYDERFSIPREMVPIGALGRISQLLAADMNKDGLPDVIALEDDAATGGSVGIAFRNAIGTYWLSDYSTTHMNVKAGQVADVDRDGYPDLLMVGDDAIVYANGIRDCSFPCVVDTSRTVSVDNTASHGLAADINRDGLLDYLTVVSNNLRLHPTTGKAYAYGSTFDTMAPIYSFGETVLTLDVYDQEHNGNLRVYALTGTNVVELVRADNEGTAAWTNTNLLPSAYHGGVFGDVNVDGNVDVVYIASDGSVNWAGRSSAVSTSFDAGGLIMAGACSTLSACKVAMGDVDGDGTWDIFIADESGGTVHHCVFGDSSSCKNVIPSGLVVAPTALAVLDADGDSDMDVVFASGGGVLWLENIGVMNRFTYDSPSTSVYVGIFAEAQPAGDERPVAERPMDVCVRPGTGGRWQRAPSLGVSVVTFEAGVVHEFAPMAVPEGPATEMDVVAPYHTPGGSQMIGVVGEMEACQFYQNGNLLTVRTGAWAYNSGTCSPQPFGCFSGALRPPIEQYTTVSLFDKEVLVALTEAGDVYLSYRQGDDTFLPSWETSHDGMPISPTTFTEATSNSGDGSAILMTGDLNGDLLEDIVVVGTRSGGSKVSWLANPGALAFVDDWSGTPNAWALEFECLFAFTTEFDFDDKAEVVCVSASSMEVAWGFDGTPASYSFSVGGSVSDAFAADVDNNGEVDIVVATTTGFAWWSVTDKSAADGYTSHEISAAPNSKTHLAFLAPGLGFVATSSTSSSIDVYKDTGASAYSPHTDALTVTGVAGLECRTAWVRANGLPQLLCMDDSGVVHELYFTGDVSSTWDQGRATDASCAVSNSFKVADLDDDGDDEFYCVASNTQSLIVTDNQMIKAASAYSGDPLTFANMRRKDAATLPITTKLCYTDGAHPPTEQLMVGGVSFVEDYALVTDVRVDSEDGSFLANTATELSFSPLSRSPKASVAFTPVGSPDCGTAGSRVGKATYAAEPFTTTITATGSYYVCVTQDDGTTWYQQSATVTVTESGDAGGSDGGDQNTGGSVGAGDPHFEGIWGGWFDFTGEADKVYNLLSDTHVQMNARFTHLDGRAGNMPGTYMSEVGLQLGGTHRILFRANGRVSIHPLHPHGSWRGRFDLGPGGFVLADGTSLDVYYDVYHIRLNKHLPPGTSAGADAVNGTHVGYRLWVNEAKLRRLGRWDTYLPHGVQGQTGRMFAVVAGTDKYGGGVVEGTWREYALPSDDLFGNDFVFNQFTKTDGARFGRGAGDDSGVESEAEAVEEMDNLQQSAQAVGGEGM